jgi:hypothetical protein
MPLQDATAASAAPRSADRVADRGGRVSHLALRAVAIGTNIVLLVAAAIARAILMIVFSLAWIVMFWIVVFSWIATLSVIGFARSLSAGRR